ncbi:hypothetical protein M758_5G101100 [Ceratodon purpureus]|nr:hypothetical protein M758_5G101100 [Ceratodon purpureus]
MLHGYSTDLKTAPASSLRCTQILFVYMVYKFLRQGMNLLEQFEIGFEYMSTTNRFLQWFHLHLITNRSVLIVCSIRGVLSGEQFLDDMTDISTVLPERYFFTTILLLITLFLVVLSLLITSLAPTRKEVLWMIPVFLLTFLLLIL